MPSLLLIIFALTLITAGTFITVYGITIREANSMRTPTLIKFKRLTATAKLPTKNYHGDAGIDIYADADNEIAPGEVVTLTTGVASEIPHGYCALIWDRSSMGASGIGKLAGVIDAGYRHAWFITLVNHGKKTKEIKSGDKIAQAIITPVVDISIIDVNDRLLATSERGTRGHGSSGR